MYKVIKFGTTWCGPCNRISEDIKKNPLNLPNVEFIEIDIDDNDEIVEKYNITSVPTSIIFDENDNEVVRMQGYKTYELYREFIKVYTE